MKINCIVVDDSSIQRLTITKLVSENPNLSLVGEFSNAIEAKNCITNKNVDLVFLDIEMPVINGFDLLDGLKAKPQVIFITSKTEYAVKAFDYAATDYLHKPITRERFNVAVKKAMNFVLLGKENSDEESPFIFIKSNLKKLKIYISRIKWIEAYGDYVKVITDEDNHLVLSTMKAFESELPNDKFIRVHKSFIVNIDKIDKFNSKFAEIGTNKIPLSRNKKEDLVKAIENT
ncbi:LytR/AlgR family response regulator transcription factor [Flavobacterium cerinum]|uniref:LytTR family DNA-binding domain-containing protein n=1 Tax=Flavobacterium cerinum TaxID=2502784 RepID=A0ABY5IRA7_9FLAO|nr:LytTR family DNA-binding domain-containing protein [Flavobacterium cerinum]UUC45391.1 LytTR family DNA-binding domain-containing protein [Flavobacterium cerinum]